MGSLDRRVRKTSTEATDAELPANCLHGIFLARFRIPHSSINHLKPLNVSSKCGGD